MATLSVPEWAMLANQVLNDERTVADVSAPFKVSDSIDGIELSLSTIERMIAGQSAGQFHFRIPGTPTGTDWNHDAHHFSTPELVTHLTGDLKGTQRSLIAEGVPLPEPLELFPPIDDVTGRHGPGFGHGGRGDITHAQTMEELRVVREQLVEPLRRAPGTLWSKPYYDQQFGSITLGQVIMIMALHSGAHAMQLMEIHAHDEYPSA